MRLPGAARQPLTFFASPKKVSKERRPRRRRPFGVPKKPEAKTGSAETRLRLKQSALLYPFCLPSFWRRRKRNSSGATGYCRFVLAKNSDACTFSVVPAKAGTQGVAGFRLRGNDERNKRSQRIGKQSETRFSGAGRCSALGIAKKLDAETDKEGQAV
jgi:hypothetical protein